MTAFETLKKCFYYTFGISIWNDIFICEFFNLHVCKTAPTWDKKDEVEAHPPAQHVAANLATRQERRRRRVCQRVAASGASSMIRLGAVPEHMCRRLGQPSRRRVVAPPAPRCGGAGASSIIHRADIIKVCVLISIMSHLRSRQLIFPSTNRWGVTGSIYN